jgi:transitional endoplasmic reticulum ATPase
LVSYLEIQKTVKPNSGASPEEALKHTSEALVSIRHFEDAIKKVRGQNEMKPEVKMNLSHYR